MFELIFLILCSVWAVLIRKDFMRAVPNPLKSVIKKISTLRAGGLLRSTLSTLCSSAGPMQKCFRRP